MANSIPEFSRYLLNKRRGMLIPAYLTLEALRLPYGKDKQSVSPR